MAAFMAAIFIAMKTFEECAAEAQKYSSRNDFRDGSHNHYSWLVRNRMLDQACAHMVPMRRAITDELIFSEAKRFKTRVEFKRADQSLYKAAYKRGLLDQACAHMDAKKRRLSNAEIAEIARRYRSRSEFYQKDTGAYQTAKKRGILDAVCAHMPAGDRRLTDAELIATARTYKTRRALKEGDFGVYTTILRRRLERKAFAHMDYGFTGFLDDQPATLYHFRLVTPEGLTLHKVGITNRPPTRRLLSMGLRRGVAAELLATIPFASGRDARMIEKRLHRKFSSHRYCGPPVMKNGNTELFTSAALEF